jgi:hypothetical protein
LKFGVAGASPMEANPPALLTLNVEFAKVRPFSVAEAAGVQPVPKQPLVEPVNVV